MKKLEIFLVIVILILAFALRLYKINRPLGDWHSWRQADTASVSRNFVKSGFTIFTPKYDDMSSQTNNLDNPNRYRFVEFPTYNILVALVWKFFGVQVMLARLVTVAITLASTLALYFLVKYFSGIKTALLSAFFFASIPYNVFYSTTILPAPLMILFLLLSYLTFAKWCQNPKWWLLIASAVCASLAILTWPIALLFLLPQIYLSLEKYRLNVFKIPALWLFLALTLLPTILWRIWISNFPAGIPSMSFVLNEGNIRFKGAFFRWLIAERLGKLILTVGGFTLLAIGVITKPSKKEGFFYLALLASVMLYFVVFASGNVRHDYYQIPAVPALTIFLSLGVRTLLSISKQNFNNFTSPVLAIFLIAIMYAFGAYEIRGYYWINKPEIIEAGAAADKILPQDATVIAPYNGDTAFLYQTNRHGYPIVDRPLTKLIESGTKYLVSVDPNDSGIAKLTKDCKVLSKTDKFVILELSISCVK